MSANHGQERGIEVETHPRFISARDIHPEATSWGSLTWLVSGELGNSEVVTFGKCELAPHQQNARHAHPNCDEVLHVVSGHIVHTMGDYQFAMRAGDTLSIPRNTAHNAINVGNERAVLIIAFSSAFREVVEA